MAERFALFGLVVTFSGRAYSVWLAEASAASTLEVCTVIAHERVVVLRACRPKKGEKKVKQKADHLVKKNKRIIPREDAKIAKKKKFDAHIVLNFLVVQCIV